MLRHLRSLFHRPTAPRRLCRARPRLEILETRLTPSTVTRTWTGAVDANLNTPGNWSAAGDPTHQQVPQPGDRLVFPANAKQFTLVNDLPTGNAPFIALTFTGNGYTIGGGNALAVNFLSDSAFSGVNTISAPLSLGTFVSVPNSSEALDLAGSITGATVIKSGQGSLFLEADNHLWSGGLVLNQGRATASNANALGSNTTPVRVAAGATLFLDGGITVAQPLLLSGYLDSGSGDNAWSGPVVLGSSQNGMIASPGSTLTIRSKISGNFQLHELGNQEGEGVLTLGGNNSFTGLKVNAGAVLDVEDAAALGKSTGTVIVDGTLELLGPPPVQVGPNHGGDNKNNLSGDLSPGLVFPNPLTLERQGTLRNVSGTSSWVGPVTLLTTYDAVTIDVAADQLIVSGTITGGSKLGLKALLKQGDGRLYLTNTNTNTNTFVGSTEIRAGLLIMMNPSALGSTTQIGTGTILVDDGATLGLQTGGVIIQLASTTFSGHPLTLNGAGYDGHGALQSLSGRNTWDQPVNLASEAAVGVSGFSGLRFNSHLNSSTSDGALDKVGLGELDLLDGGTTPGTYSGPTNIIEGNLQIVTSTGLGTGETDATVFHGATLSIIPSNIKSPIALPTDLTLEAGATVQLGNNVNLTGGVSLAGTATVAVVGPAANITGTIAGVDGAGLNVQGPGTLVLSADNTYNGPTEVQSGKLIVQGSQQASALTVDAHAELDLALTALVGGVTAQDGSTFVPAGGSAFGDVNILGINPGAIFTATLGSAASTPPQLTAQAGTVTLGGTLAVNVIANTTFKLGDKFTLVKNLTGKSITTTFANRPDRSVIKLTNTLGLQINYKDGPTGDVTLTVVPLLA